MPHRFDDSQTFVKEYVNPRQLSQLLNEQDNSIRGLIQTDIDTMDVPMLHAVFRDLIGIISTDEDDTTAYGLQAQDARDAALVVAGLLPYNKMQAFELMQVYKNELKVMGNQPALDLFGSVEGMVRLGKLFAPFLGAGETTQDLMGGKSFAPVINRFKNSADQYTIRVWNAEIFSLIPQETLQLDNRDKPPMTEGIEQLHDLYLELAKQHGSIKVALWDRVPEFRQLCSQYGINLAEFWNLRDPQKVHDQLNKFATIEDKLVQNAFKRASNNLIGYDLLEYKHTGIPYVLADQVVEIGRNAQAILRQQLKDPQNIENTFEGFLKQITGKNTVGPKVLNNIISFLGSYISFDDRNTVKSEDLIKILSSQQIKEHIKSSITSQNQTIIRSIEVLDDQFEIKKHDNGFALISRSESDLYLGDLTGDCTAYHLNIGVNAWTVPVWLTKAGFTMFTIDGGKTAKFGLVLGVQDNKPILVIDSIEVGSQIKDEENALKRIHEGFSYLKGWAEAIGLDTQLLIQHSNTSRYTELISKIVGEECIIADAYILGGIDDLIEFQTNAGITKPVEDIFLQAINSEDVDNRDTDERIILQQKFEIMINTVVNKIKDIGVLNTFTQFLREKDWKNVNAIIISTLYPNLKEYLVQYDHRYLTDPDSIYTELTHDHTIFKLDEIGKFLDDLFDSKLYSELDDETYRSVHNQYGKNISEYQEFRGFAELLFDLYMSNNSPKSILQSLYGTRNSISDEYFMLSNDLLKLK